jgi:predicted AAA+ superfamily ATPase
MTDPILSCETATSLLARIADALERMAPPAPPPVDWLAAPAYVWTGQSARGVDHLEAPALGLMRGIDARRPRWSPRGAPRQRGRRARHAAVGFARDGQIGRSARGGQGR